MPGMRPWCASSRRQMRQMPNLRYTARGRPQRRQREWARVGYFGGRAWRTLWDVLAMWKCSVYLLSGDGLGAQRLEPGGTALTREGQAQAVEQRERLGVGLRGRGDGDVEAADLVHGVVVDLGEDDLLADPQRVVPAPVEGARVQSAEVAQTRDGDRGQAVEELERALLAQRDAEPDRHALAQLERGDGLAGPADVRLLAGDVGQLLPRRLEHLRVLLALAHAHVERDLDQARRLHRGGVAEPPHERVAQLLVVAVLESCHQSI